MTGVPGSERLSWIDHCYSMVPEGIFTGATIAVLTCGLWLTLGVLDPVNPFVAITLLLVALAAGAAAGAALAVIAALVMRTQQSPLEPDPQDQVPLSAAKPAAAQVQDGVGTHILR